MPYFGFYLKNCIDFCFFTLQIWWCYFIILKTTIHQVRLCLGIYYYQYLWQANYENMLMLYALLTQVHTSTYSHAHTHTYNMKMLILVTVILDLYFSQTKQVRIQGTVLCWKRKHTVISHSPVSWMPTISTQSLFPSSHRSAACRLVFAWCKCKFLQYRLDFWFYKFWEICL